MLIPELFLDTGGAERLIGAGDGLFISTTLHRPIRVKAPFLTESEIHKVIDFWKDQAEELPFERQTIPLEEIESKNYYLKRRGRR
jgi:DNA segregation ATPase FtsK/SpoIIIE-like protein